MVTGKISPSSVNVLPEPSGPQMRLNLPSGNWALRSGIVNFLPPPGVLHPLGVLNPETGLDLEEGSSGSAEGQLMVALMKATEELSFLEKSGGFKATRASSEPTSLTSSSARYFSVASLQIRNARMISRACSLTYAPQRNETLKGVDECIRQHVNRVAEFIEDCQ